MAAPGGITAVDMDDDECVDVSLDGALRFARTNPNAVVLSLWPSAIGHAETQVDVARAWLRRAGATILHESSLHVPDGASTLLVLAMYWGEDWLRTNCWYGEQPLEGLGVPGLSRPTGAWPGAKWKKELCFRPGPSPGEEAAATRMHVLVADVGDGDGRSRLWSEKYAVRTAMARDTGRAGNSCMHLTDDQAGIVAGGNGTPRSWGTGTECNASYAFACARCLLNPEAMKFLNYCATEAFVTDNDLQSNDFTRAFDAFCKWLGDRSFEDVITLPSSSAEECKKGDEMVRKWNRPPTW